MNITFSKGAWRDYVLWQTKDKKKVKKINDLLKDITRHPYEGIGHPEPLKEELTGFWSRRIDQEHRLIYRITILNSVEHVEITQVRGHY